MMATNPLSTNAWDRCIPDDARPPRCRSTRAPKQLGEAGSDER